MIRINLSPQKQVKKKENVRVQALIFILALTATLAGCFFFYSQHASEISKLAAVAKQKEANLKPYLPDEKKLQEVQFKEDDLQNKKNIIKQIVARRELPIRILDELSKTLVLDKLWLFSIKEEGPRLTIEGYALDNQTIAKFMKELENSPFFTKVDLVKSEQEWLQKYLKDLEKLVQKRVTKLGIKKYDYWADLWAPFLEQQKWAQSKLQKFIINAEVKA